MRPDPRAVVVLVALLPTLAACGDEPSPERPVAVQTARNGDVFNTADVEFATAMIPHHAQAVQMALLAQDRPLAPEVRALVEQVQATQVPEVETMTTWLTDWDQEIPPTTLDHVHGGHGHEGGEMPDDLPDMPGMMSADRIEELESSSDAAFPRLWLTMMIEHHEGAIAMAEEERENGRFPDAVALADDIVQAQTAEIAAMEDLLEE
ncbi:DUF305 domain-containing protein [Nocardioides sp. R1-1]|uniref:DUF305 domain-containing protein n=1 Tax=Nocardioides sp. R1-1 TaxID=3383502 RepID=UPI0038D15CBB